MTKNNTIVVNWDYILESCDKNIVVYWSKYGPVTIKNSISIKLSNPRNRSYEITQLGMSYLFYCMKSTYLIVT